jgi:hypothetical protein
VKRALSILTLVGGLVLLGLQVLGAAPHANPLSVVSLQGQTPLFQAAGTKSLRSIHFVGAPPAVDGILNDWPTGESVDLNRSTAYAFSGRIDSTADLSATIRSGWTESTLYFAVQVSDDVIVADSTEVWRDDGVEFGLDGLRDKQPWGMDDHQYTVVADGRVTDRAMPTQSITAAVVIRPGGYDVEVAIPMARLMSGVPISGTVMGFTIGLHDDDDGGNWDAYLIWDGTNTSSLEDQFASLIFIERSEDKIAFLEAKVAQLEAKVQELLVILSEFERVTPP